MPRQFLAIEFKPGGRQYTYHNEGEPVQVGDRVVIEVRNGARQTVTVASVWADAPTFETKPILGPVDGLLGDPADEPLPPAA